MDSASLNGHLEVVKYLQSHMKYITNL
jgi:hypothetical protein